MAAINQITIAGGSTYDVNDKRITTSAVSTATHFLATDSSISSIAPITAANLASVLGGVKGYELPGDGNSKWYKVIDVTNQKSFAFFVAHDFYRNASPAIYLITGYMYDINSECSFYYLIGPGKDYARRCIKVKVDSSTKRTTIWINLIGSGTFSHVIPIAGSIPLSRVEETPPEDAVNPTFVN